jgi:hypothetical protein
MIDCVDTLFVLFVPSRAERGGGDAVRGARTGYDQNSPAHVLLAARACSGMPAFFGAWHR